MNTPSSDNYNKILDNTHDIIYQLDREGIFTYVSPAWELLLGHKVEEVVNKPFTPFVHPEDVQS